MQDHSVLDFFDRELDLVVGTVLWLTLTMLSLLPIAGLHANLLFNRAYAVAINRLNQQNELLQAITQP